jgi:aspartyl-tRNA(Asn)/glutamyl-tRNA(Gln) amidotransferase subunit B
MPELPGQMAARFVASHGLSLDAAAQMTQTRAHAAYFEACVAGGAAPKLAANWIMGELAAQLNRDERDIGASPVSAAQLAALTRKIDDGTLSSKTAKEVFAALWAGEQGGDVAAIIDARGLAQVNDSAALQAAVDAVLAANPKNVEEYRAGKDKALNALVGQVMKATGGRANPQQVGEMLKKAVG